MDDYALVPEHEVEDLKKQVENLRKNPVGNTAEGKELMDQLSSLNQTIHSLMSYFKEASTSLEKYESKPKESPRVESKIDELIEQNKKIAKGIIAVADMVKDLTVKVENHPEVDKPKFDQPKPMNQVPPRMDQGFNPEPPAFSPPKMEAPTMAPPKAPEFDSGLPPLPDDLPPLGPAPTPPKSKKKLFGF